MKEGKFVKALCRATGQHFGLIVRKFGSVWKVVNFISIGDAESALLASEVRQDELETNENLRPCAKCGSRKVGGCHCPPIGFNCRSGKYNLQCVYCKNLQIDYSAPSSLSGYREGDIIRLAQGEEVKIRLADNKPLTKVIVGLGWDPAHRGENIDVDSSVVISGDRTDVVYYGALQHPSGCVIHHGDNLTGEDVGPQRDDENITVYLDKVPANMDRLVFVLNIYDCVNRSQKFGDINNMYIRLSDPDSHKTLIEYRVDGDYSRFTSLIIGKAYRQGRDWSFKAIGQGSYSTHISQLAQEAVRV